MHLKIQKRGNRSYLSVVQNYRQAGKVKSRTVKTIGYADAYAEEFEDPIAHFKAYVEKLNQDAGQKRQPVELSFELDEAIEPEAVPPARLGAAIALGCLDALGVKDFFRSRSGHEGFCTIDGRVFEALATERMMHATSKRESWAARKSFPRTCDFTFEDVYNALGCFAREKTRVDDCLARHWSRIAGERKVERVFLICGSYAFPVDGGSERASIAVALDPDGMPLGYHDMPGRLGPNAFREAVDRIRERTGCERAVVVAGGLRELEPTMSELSSTGDGFVLYQRDFRNVPELSAWADDEEGYVRMSGSVFMKSRVYDRPLPDGASTPVKEVLLRGGGYATKHRHAILVSSELDLNVTEIVQLYRELWRQAEPFQPLEADFSSMPVPVASHDHIQAHFAICYAAFFALRALRWKMGWLYNAADTADALLHMEGLHLKQNYYLFNYRSDVTDCIEEAIGIGMARRLRTRADLRGIMGTVKRSFQSAE